MKMRNTNKNPAVYRFIFFFLFLQTCLFQFCTANTLTRGQPLRDSADHKPLSSPDKTFELGFFSPGISMLRYLCIRYGNIEDKAVVWVANREKPISGQSGVLTFANDGNLVLLDGNNSLIWSSNAKIESTNTTAVLQNNGNFILKDSGSVGDDAVKTYWQSFDYPTDTFLPEMKVRVNAKTGENRAFVSWKSENDPSPGNFTMGVDPSGAPQIVVWEGNSSRTWRSGQWNSAIFTGIPTMSVLTNYLYGFKLSSPPDEDGSVYFTYVPSDSSLLLRFRILYNGTEEELRWDSAKKQWGVFQSEPATECDKYNRCGNYGVCDIKDPNWCSCIKGYEPRFPGDWSRGNWSGGCKRRTELKCQRNTSLVKTGDDEFFGLKSVKLPDFGTVMPSIDSDDCKEKCQENCSCNAYAFVGGIGCMIWSSVLIDLQQFATGGNLLHIRLADSEFGKRKVSDLAIIIPIVVGTILLAMFTLLLYRFKKRKATCCKNSDVSVVEVTKSGGSSAALSGSVDIVIEGKPVNTSELPIFSFSTIAAATNNFHEQNQLGKGGFGPVYKGQLSNGQEIAVKRLSGKSGQGAEEFKNEIILIAKLQHRNLVRLLGCCFEGEEKMLIYEHMPNKSLDFFIFDKTKQELLDWKLRFNIIEGIARGLLYLHRDSRLRIIHRDLKVSNILLDAEMNPKISDFGMARIFGGNQNEANTVRVVGTYGYMSPEYAMEGLFSVKSDVYSFGVLLLEIISGKRNTSLRSSEHGSLIGYAWHLWSHGKALDLLDPSIKGSCSKHESLRCIHVGLLCVQDSALERPNMASVLLMLESETAPLALPRQPTFTSRRSSIDMNFVLDSTQYAVSSNDITASVVTGR